MIEIRKNPDPQSRIEYLLFIDGVLLENAPVSPSADGYWITVRDFETSAKIAKHSLSEFPPFRYMNLWSYPEGIQHRDKSEDVSILLEMKKNEKTGEWEDADTYTVSLALGKTALSQWRSPYSFADYACEMYQLLEDNIWVTGLSLINSDNDTLDRRREEDDEGNPAYTKIDIDQVDKARIFGLEMTFRYSSPEVRIEDELRRISEIIEEAHAKSVSVLAPQNIPIQILRTGDTEPTYQLLVNGSPLSAYVYEEKLFGWSGAGISIQIHKLETLYNFGGRLFSDIPKDVRNIQISLDTEFHSNLGHINMYPSAVISTPSTDPNEEYDGYISEHSPFGKDYSITFLCSLDVDGWKGESSPNDFLREMRETLTVNRTEDSFRFESRFEHRPGDYEYNIDIRITPDSGIVEEVLRWRDYLREIFDDIENKLASISNPSSITRSFDLPKEVEVFCVQYLSYFIQFLHDLGVDATSEVKHKAGQVLFTVTPVNEEEALDKIRAALEIYLHLPASPVGNDMSNEIAVQRLESQVLRFQSDLKLAAAELQAKNATIEAQQLTISVQKALLSGEILLDSMKDVIPKPQEDDKEELLGGTVALTRTNWKGVEFNLPEIFRKLRRLFKEGE
jgi:hypothetical protein